MQAKRIMTVLDRNTGSSRVEAQIVARGDEYKARGADQYAAPKFRAESYEARISVDGKATTKRGFASAADADDFIEKTTGHGTGYGAGAKWRRPEETKEI